MNLDNQTVLKNDARNKKKSSLKEESSFTCKGKLDDKRMTNNAIPTTKKNLFPWLNDDKTIKSDEEILLISQNWTANEWDNYLKDTVGTLEDDDLSFFENMDTEVTYERADFLAWLRTTADYPHFQDALHLAMNSLSKRERDVIELRFWGDMQNKEIAKKLGVSISTVKTFRQRGLDKIEKELNSPRFKKRLKQSKSLKKKATK